MAVDLAHPVCGLLSLSVVQPLSEQSRHRDQGKHGVGGGFAEYSCHSTPHNLGIWQEGEFHGTETKTEMELLCDDLAQDMFFCGLV